MRFKPQVIAAFALPCLVSAHAVAQTGQLVADGTSYASAREALLKSGYKPVSHDGVERCSTFTAICGAFPEAATCASGNVGTCRFEWTRAGGTPGATFIDTRGDAPDRLVVIRSFEAGAVGSPYPLGTLN